MVVHPPAKRSMFTRFMAHKLSIILAIMLGQSALANASTSCRSDGSALSGVLESPEVSCTGECDPVADAKRVLPCYGSECVRERQPSRPPVERKDGPECIDGGPTCSGGGPGNIERGLWLFTVVLSESPSASYSGGTLPGAGEMVHNETFQHWSPRPPVPPPRRRV